MSGDTIAIYIGVGIYFAIMMAVGYIVKSKIKVTEDYLVGGRKFTLLFNAPALAACFLGGSLILALPGVTYGMGVWSDANMWGINPQLGSVFCLLAAGFFYMPKLWRLKLLSLGDFFYLRFGRGTGFTVSVVTVFTFIFWIAVQILVFAKICTVFMGWPLVTSALIGISVITVYTTMGGLWAVMVTDMIQVTLVTVGVVVLFFVTVNLVGGWETFMESIPADKNHWVPSVQETPGATLHVWLAFIAGYALMAVGSIVSPDLMQRAFAAKTASVARNSAIIAALIKAALCVIMVGVAFVGYILVQDGIFSEELMGGDVELLVPVMVKEFLPLPVVILFVGACLSSVMGAASSALLALSGMMSKNIIKDFIKPDISDKQLVFACRACVIAFAVLGIVCALSLKYVYLLVALGFDLIMASLFACMTLGMFWKKTNQYGAVAGIIAGLAFRVLGPALTEGISLTSIAYAGDTWYLWTLLSPILAFAVTIVVSLATQKQNPSNEYGFHFDANGDVVMPDGSKVVNGKVENRAA